MIWVYTVCICHFIRNFGVRNSRTFTVFAILIQHLKANVCVRSNCFSSAYLQGLLLIQQKNVSFMFELRHLYSRQFLNLTLYER